MGIAIALRDDYDGAFLRRLAKASSYTWQVRRHEGMGTWVLINARWY